MKKPSRHLFVCGSFRGSGDAHGLCQKKNSHQLVSYLETELSDRGMDGYMVSACGCLKACVEGPLMVAYPEGDWYGKLSEDTIDAILDSWESGESAEGYQVR